VEALAFLEVWAAHDKQKLVDAGKDARGYHAQRREQFLNDVEIPLDELLDEGKPAGNVDPLAALRAAGGEREVAVREIRTLEGWLAT
jgi:hypothetical protein